MRLHPDALHLGEWENVRRIEADPQAPDGRPWDDEATLARLVAWAECGYFLFGGRD